MKLNEDQTHLNLMNSNYRITKKKRTVTITIIISTLDKAK